MYKDTYNNTGQKITSKLPLKEPKDIHFSNKQKKINYGYNDIDFKINGNKSNQIEPIPFQMDGMGDGLGVTTNEKENSGTKEFTIRKNKSRKDIESYIN